jgi:hypothetical protein
VLSWDALQHLQSHCHYYSTLTLTRCSISPSFVIANLAFIVSLELHPLHSSSLFIKYFIDQSRFPKLTNQRQLTLVVTYIWVKKPLSIVLDVRGTPLDLSSFIFLSLSLFLFLIHLFLVHLLVALVVTVTVMVTVT